ncbi:hypothetical protein MASR2M78_19970 [Treponema sp.]
MRSRCAFFSASLSGNSRRSRGFIPRIHLRKVWKLGEDGIQNVIEMLEEHRIKVLEIDADLSFDGLSTIVNARYPVIDVSCWAPWYQH